jgi:hypothetical protein
MFGEVWLGNAEKGGWVGPRVVANVLEKKLLSDFTWNWIPDGSSHILSHFTDRAIAAL